MFEFDPANPFPILNEGELSYAEEQAHSVEVDKWLGYLTEPIERAIENKVSSSEVSNRGVTGEQQLWIGLGTQRLQTPYMEIRRLLEKIAPRKGDTVIDLGAAYGRMGFILERHHPDVNFVGYEFVDERVREAQRIFARHGLSRSRVEKADLSDAEFFLPPAPFYFLFDYGARRAIEKTLQDLQIIARSRAITVIGRGRASRNAIERNHPWLSGVRPPEHFSHYSIYKS